MKNIQDYNQLGNSFDISEALKQAMHRYGIDCTDNIPVDGKIHRFHVAGDKKGSKNGWALLHDDPPAGAFGCWKRNIRAKLNLPSHADPSSLYRRRNIEASADKTATEKHQKDKIIELWELATPATDGCKYLRVKKVKSYGLRYFQNALLIPVKDIDGNIHGVQRIWPDGSKRFMPGTSKKGHFYQIGSIINNIVLIAEGYATAATLHQVTGYSSIVAFDADNLLPAAVAFRSVYPNLKIYICADDDWKSLDNPGLSSASSAAVMTDSELLSPVFPDRRSDDDTDFNDLYILGSYEAVRACLPFVEDNNV